MGITCEKIGFLVFKIGKKKDGKIGREIFWWGEGWGKKGGGGGVGWCWGGGGGGEGAVSVK